MKLKIEKVGAHVRIEITPAPGTKPAGVNLDTKKLDQLITLIETARKAERFDFTLEI